MTITGYIVIATSVVLAIAWLPIARFFWKSWRARGAPLSLAICALAAYPIYTNLSSCVFLRNDPLWTISALVFVNTLVLGNFYWQFWKQRKTFPDARKPTEPGERPTFWPSWRSKD